MNGVRDRTDGISLRTKTGLPFLNHDIADTGSFESIETVCWLFRLVTLTSESLVGWDAVAISVSENGENLTHLIMSWGNFFLQTTVILDESNAIISDLTAATIKRLLHMLQSADSKGSTPQWRLRMGL